jgi:hypothetical protein
LDWFEIRSMKFWYARNCTQHCTADSHRACLHFNNALMSLSLLASSSFLKSLVFCARSFLCVSVSRWYATMSEATVSSCGTSVVRSMSGAMSGSHYNQTMRKTILLLHAPIAVWNLFSSAASSSAPATGWALSCAASRELRPPFLLLLSRISRQWMAVV